MRFTSVLRDKAVPFSQISHSLRSLKNQNSHSYDRRLTHVTSQQLCDDVLLALDSGPYRLPGPGTCDIIDLNPGPCLWSQKLHNLLKPRRHVLVEPRQQVFAQFMDPLLNEPGSAYRYANTVNKALDPQERLLSEDTYLFMTKMRETSSRGAYHVNRNLLMTANLSGMAKKITGFTGSQAKQFLNDYYRAIFVQDNYIHRYGLVRLLAWVGEDARLSIMPTSVNSRTKQSVQLDATCVLSQIAGPSQFRNLHPHQKRWHDIDVEQQEQVRELQDKKGPIIHQNRVQPNPVPPFNSLTPSVDEVRKKKDLYPYNQTYIRRLIELDDQLAVEDADWYTEYHLAAHSPGRDTARTKDHDLKVRRTEYRILLNQLRTHHNTYLKAKDFITEQRQVFSGVMHRMSRGWLLDRSGSPVKDGTHHKRSSKLIQDGDFMQKQLKLIKTDTRAMIQKAVDDYRCCDSGTMAWNWRKHDPLLVRDDEFFPKNSLSLIDFDPGAHAPELINTVDKQICFDYVCTMLMTNPGQTVLQGIKRLVPAGWDQFIERVPALKNPIMGGSWNLEHVRIRTLSTNAFIDIALAFNDWPHRPEIGKLMTIYKGVYDDGPK